MRRDDATKLARELLDFHLLNDWKVHCVNDLRPKSFLGKCVYDKKTILLNVHHLDIHPDVEIKDTILHEIAHALTPGHNHNEVWQAKAKELGATPAATCNLTLDPKLIDAMRSGYIVESVTEEKVVRETSYKVTRLQDKCEFCGKVARESKTFESHDKKFITLECGHLIVKNLPKATPFHTLTFDGDEKCAHNWSLPATNEYKTICSKCSAKRPYKFQIEGMLAIEKHEGRFGVFDEQGLGKTIQSLGYIKFHPEVAPVLWICKSGLKFQAAKEMVRILGYKYFPYIFQSGKDHIFPTFNAYIISYDMLRRMSSAKIEELKKIVKCVVIDEVQHIKNPDSTRTQEVRKLCREVEHIIPLSGTHWKNRGSESFVACNLINPTKFHSFEGFKTRWVSYYYEGDKLKEGGLKKGFREYCNDVFIRRERQEVMKELPLINRTKLFVQLPKETMEAYDDVVDDFVKVWNNLVIGGEENSFAAGSSIMAALNQMRQIIGIAKIPGTVDYAQEFMENTERKLLIFVHHVAVGQNIYNQLQPIARELGYKLFKLTSDMSSEDRHKMCEEFNSNSKSVAVLSTLASGEGLNLQTCADAIMHERQWNPANEEQAEGRMIRIGQLATNVNMTYVEASESVDEDLDGIVSRKRVHFHNTMNKGEMPQWNQQSIIKELGNATAERWRKKNKKS